MTTTYCVILNEPSEEIPRNAHALFENTYQLSDSCVLVRAGDVTARGVAAALGLRPADDDECGDDQPSGVVFSLNGSFSGYNSSSLWDWLTADQASA